MADKQCRICLEVKDESNYYGRAINRNWKRTECNKCSRTMRQITKYEACMILGGVCICCKEEKLWNLTIDHKIPVSGKRPLSRSVHEWVVKNPEIAHNYYQILCQGCNNSKNTSNECMLEHDKILEFSESMEWDFSEVECHS